MIVKSCKRWSELYRCSRSIEKPKVSNQAILFPPENKYLTDFDTPPMKGRNLGAHQIL
jgi:hypothetical protein